MGAAGPGRDGGPEPTLHAVSRELGRARDMALDLQDAMSGLIGRAGADSLSAEMLFRLQSLDRLTQTLDGLSGFVAGLARAVPDGWVIDAVSAARELRLHDLAVRLAGGEGDRPDASADDFLL